MENKLKRAVEGIELPEAAAARIRAGLSSAPAGKPHRRLRGRAVIIAAAAAALLIIGAGAAYAQVFRNSEIVGGVEDIPEPTFRNSGILEDSGPEIAVSYTRSNADFGAPRTLDESAESIRKLYASFGTDERLGGRVLSEPWTGSRVLRGSGDVLEREVYNASGYVKRDLLPARIELVADEIAPFVVIDFSELGRLAEIAPESGLISITTDSDGALYSRSLTAYYSAGDDGAWFMLDVDRLDQHEWGGSSYIFEGDWDKAYVYKNAEGLEFVITALDSRVDAECTTAHTSIMITSYFMSTAELEAVLDCISLPEG